MDTNTLPSYLRDLLAEVSLMDEEAFPPSGEIKPCERILGPVADTFARKLFASATMHRREADRARIDCRYTTHKGENNCEHAREVDIHESRANLLSALAWALIHEQFNNWGRGGYYQMRKNWTVTHADRDPDGMNDFIRRLLGGGM